MIFLGFFLWFFQQIFVYIILLNFFIALVGDAYDGVVSQSEEK